MKFGVLEHGFICRPANEVEVVVYLQEDLRNGVGELEFDRDVGARVVSR